MKYEIGYSSAGGFMVQEFHEDDPIAREAALEQNRRTEAAEQRATRAEGVVEAARELELTLRNTWFLCGRAGGKSLLADAWRSTADALATYDQEDRK